VVCEETTPDTICTAGFTCDGTCPGDLVCNGPINNQNGDVVGQACQ
jgi:hypothetical protein